MYRAFNKYDKDHSGSLDVKELLNLLKEEVPDSTDKDAQWFLGMVDADNSNNVSFAEYIRGVAEFGKKGRREPTRYI